MSTAQEFEPNAVVVGIIALTTIIGIFGAGQFGDAGIAVTWMWTGIALSGTYLLYRILATLERIAEALSQTQ